MKTNVLIHEGVALRMDWVEKPTYHSNGEYYSIELHNYALVREKAIKERIEYEDQNAVIDLLIVWNYFNYEKPNDGIYVVDLPDTETVEQYRIKTDFAILHKWVDHDPGLAYLHECFEYRKVARFKKENEHVEIGKKTGSQLAIEAANEREQIAQILEKHYGKGNAINKCVHEIHKFRNLLNV